MDRFQELEHNISLLLQVPELPIIYPLYEKSSIAIDVLNQQRTNVELKSILPNIERPKLTLPIVLGNDVYNKPFVVDLKDTPHMLVAGTTGSGKSVGLRSMLTSLLYFNKNIDLILIDPKAVELVIFDELKLADVITDMDKVDQIFDYVLYQVQERYRQLRKRNVSNISEVTDMRYLVLVIDELADLFQFNSDAQSILLKIVQKSRAAGVHVIAATQRPSVDVVSGVIKNNFPTRVAYKVSSYEDSRTIIGERGAERLLGQGDLLYRGSSNAFERVQGAYVSNSDICALLS